METVLKTYHFDKKTRKGINQDGGYVIADLDGGYDCYISCGICMEESFSRDFIQSYGMNKNNSFAFDGSIQNYPYHYTNEITFYKKNINNFNDDKNTNLKFVTENYKNIFLKMDIEGGEYPWLLSIDESSLKNFKQIVIEFHGINDDTWGCSFVDKFKCLEKLSNTHYIIHAHPNNNGNIKDGIPDVIELTYVNKSYFNNIPSYNSSEFPVKDLDFPNNPLKRDITINNPPFVQKLV